MLERHSPDREHALLYYVPPHLGWYEPKTNGQTEYQRIEGETEDDRLVALMRIGKWLRIAEDPGVGKSVFTKRLRAFLSGEKAQQEFFGGKPPLVVLWEETDGTWPKTDFVTALDNALSGFCQTEPSCDPCDVRQYALERERVVIILDAMDQVGDAKHIQAILSRLREFLSAEGKHCRVILTGRPLIMNANSSKLPHLSDWKLAHIEEFDLRQQYQYLYGPTEAELQELFGEDAANTLRVMTPDQQDELDLEDDSTPIVYRLVEEVDATDDDEIQNVLRQRFPHFDAVSDLLTTPHNLFLIRRLAQENGGLIPPFETRADIYWQTCEASIRRALSRLSADEHLAVDVEETTARLQAILAAIACEMMVQAPERHDVQGSQEITQLRQVAGRRIENGTITDQDWRLLQQVTPITRRGIIRELETAELRWHHPRMMQFFCGLHLARNSQPDWEREPSRYNEKTDEYELDAIACGDRRATPQSRSVRDHAANPLWEEAFRFAMEIPATVRDPSILRSSLSLLFEAPKPRLGFVRPSQLIWEAWQLFEPEDGSSTILQGAEVIRRQFQQPYENMLTGKGTPEQQQIADVFEQGFVLCPPSKENLSPEGVYQFTMGTTGIIRKEAAVEVELSPFLMQQFPVTREQYALYDPRHDQAHQADMDKYSSEPCCPVIDVTWWDAWCFAMFTGKVLPSEAQWECACRAGTTTPFAFGKELTQEQANFKRMVGHTTPQGTYPPPTEWKLYDMHGNVWEWCQDWFHDKLPGGRNPVILERASIRVYRGGSWRHSAGRCRSASRDWYWPGRRYNNLGFRVVAVPAEPSPASATRHVVRYGPWSGSAGSRRSVRRSGEQSKNARMAAG